MTDAQYLFDLAARQYNETAEVIERHFEHVADQIRDWIPQRVQYSAPPPPPPRRLVAGTYLSKIQAWTLRNRALTAGLLAFVGTGTIYLFIQRRVYRQKRRAKRAANGARTEVVVIAGSANSAITTALALDLERRGYIVYIVASSQEDVQHIRNQSRADILPLLLDLVHPETANEQVVRVHDMLSRHHYAVQGEQGHRLTLSGVIVIPDAQFQSGLITDVSAQDWSNALNAKVLNTILTVQHLYPLVTDFHSRVLLLTPSIIPSLNPPNHAVQSTVAGALQGFSASLAAELQTRNVRLCHFKLGHLELPGSHGRTLDGNRRSRGTPIRRLHDSVFDALQARRPSRTWHVGKGSLTYDMIGSWLPTGMVGWMMGLSRRRNHASRASPEQKVIDFADSNSEGSAQWEKIDEGAGQGSRLA